MGFDKSHLIAVSDLKEQIPDVRELFVSRALWPCTTGPDLNPPPKITTTSLTAELRGTSSNSLRSALIFSKHMCHVRGKEEQILPSWGSRRSARNSQLLHTRPGLLWLPLHASSPNGPGAVPVLGLARCIECSRPWQYTPAFSECTG
ncbi:hypothetical protein AOLI_G00186110 [Acnodon oligacanthus]